MKNICLLFTLSFLIACSSQTSTSINPAATNTESESATAASFKNIKAEQFKTRMGQPGVFILDVRTPAETNEGKIQGAVELDFRAAGFKDKMSKLPTDKEYLVYCKSGGRSSKAAQIMVDMGFENVSNLLGGYEGWTAGQ